MTEEIKIASNPSKDGLREQLARYWYTEKDKIEIRGADVFQAGKKMNARVKDWRGGFLAYHPAES